MLLLPTSHVQAEVVLERRSSAVRLSLPTNTSTRLDRHLFVHDSWLQLPYLIGRRGKYIRQKGKSDIKTLSLCDIQQPYLETNGISKPR
jgi:hypothetical protein